MASKSMRKSKDQKKLKHWIDQRKDKYYKPTKICNRYKRLLFYFF